MPEKTLNRYCQFIEWGCLQFIWFYNRWHSVWCSS